MRKDEIYLNISFSGMSDITQITYDNEQHIINNIIKR